MKESFMTIVDKPFRGSGIPWSENWSYQETEVVIHRDWQWYAGTFPSRQVVDELFAYLGVTYKFREKKTTLNNGNLYYYDLSHDFKDAYTGGFWHLEDVPAEVKPITALSNGSFVDCFAYNDGETIWIYRPNPNAKDVYKPMPIEEHIKHDLQFGSISRR